MSNLTLTRKAEREKTPQEIAADILPAGMGAPFFGEVSPQGWLLADGRTIGNSDSGATSLASDSAYRLFTHLWNSYAQGQLPIQTSTGSASTRGVSAQADWDANKRMPLPDSRGRVLASKDNLGGTAANRLTSAISGVGNVLGASGGDQRLHEHNHNMANHSHTINHNHAAVTSVGPSSQYVQGEGNSAFRVGFGGTGGSGAVRFDNLDVSTANLLHPFIHPHTHSVDLPSISEVSGGPNIGNTLESGAGVSQNVQPTLIVSYIIKL